MSTILTNINKLDYFRLFKLDFIFSNNNLLIFRLATLSEQNINNSINDVYDHIISIYIW